MTLKPVPISSKYASSRVRVLDIEGHAVNLDLIVLRDTELQKDSPRFREALHNIGYDIGRLIVQDLIRKNPVTRQVTTPLGTAEQLVYNGEPILLNILRASDPMCNGILRAFPYADTGFVGASRDHGDVRKDGSLGVKMDYNTVPSIKGKYLIMVDPMLATGSSLIDIYDHIRVDQGAEPEKTFIASAIASAKGVARVLAAMPHARIITASLDPHLNEKGYILPGLGDAGNLCFGKKYGE